MPEIRAGTVVGLQRSSGGVPKLAVHEAMVGPTGIEGDRQRKPFIHGGPKRALCLYSKERIDALAAEGHLIEPGSVGENVTIAGLDWDDVAPGSRFTLGEVEAEVTAFTPPCRTVAGVFVDRKFKRIDQGKHPGWSRVYVKILRGGRITVGDAVVLTMAGARE